MESATYYTDINPSFVSEEKEQSAIFPLTHQQQQSIAKRLSSLDLGLLVNQVYRQHLSDASYSAIKHKNISLAALVELQRHHWEMILNFGCAFDVVKHCLVDMGVVYAKVKLAKPILAASLSILKKALIDQLKEEEHSSCRDGALFNETLELFFVKIHEIALMSYDYYRDMQQEQGIKSPSTSSVRAMKLSPCHLYLCLNKSFALDEHWQTMSDRVLMMLNESNYQQFYFDLSYLSDMDPHEKEFIIFDVKQYCFIKNIELFIIGLDDAGLEDVLVDSDDIQDRKVHFCSSLETAMLIDKPFASSVLQ